MSSGAPVNCRKNPTPAEAALQQKVLREAQEELARQMGRKQSKAAAKANQKRKRKLGNRQPSGFVKPTPISS